MGLSHSAELDVAESPAEEALPAVSHVDALPDELAVRVCSTLGASDLVSLMRTSRRFRDMIRADVALWDGLAADRFGPATADPADGDGEQPATQLIDMDLLTSIIERIAMPDEPEPEAPLRSERARAISLVPSGVPHPTRSTERLSLTGGLPNYVRLVAVQRALARQLRVLEADISDLPFSVDAIAVPSNEVRRAARRTLIPAPASPYPPIYPIPLPADPRRRPARRLPLRSSSRTRASARCSPSTATPARSWSTTSAAG